MRLDEKKKANKPSSLNDVVGEAGKEWKQIKEGKHPKYIPGKPKPRKKSRKKSAKKGHKGAPSITRPGHIDFRTHKGSKFYNRDDHRQTFNEEGVIGKPYVGPKKTRRKSKKRKGRKTKKTRKTRKTRKTKRTRMTKKAKKTRKTRISRARRRRDEAGAPKTRDQNTTLALYKSDIATLQSQLDACRSAPVSPQDNTRLETIQDDLDGCRSSLSNSQSSLDSLQTELDSCRQELDNFQNQEPATPPLQDMPMPEPVEAPQQIADAETAADDTFASNLDKEQSKEKLAQAAIAVKDALGDKEDSYKEKAQAIGAEVEEAKDKVTQGLAGAEDKVTQGLADTKDKIKEALGMGEQGAQVGGGRRRRRK